MMKNIRIALLVYVVLISGVTLGAATRPKFQPSGSGDAGIGRYVVTLGEDTVADDLGALKRELALTYGARLEANASSDGQQFVVTMISAHARLLSADPRVSEVAEVPLTTSAAAPPETLAVAPASVSSPRRFTPQPSGYGDNGQSGTYTYDGAGNITAIGADTFAYDTAQRLVSSVTRGVPENYSYEAFGNRKSATGAINCLGQTTCAQTVTVDSNTNHLTTINGAAVTYDEAGNIKSIAATSGAPGAVYTYDGAGMMTEATVGSDDRQFIDTADDERIAVKQGVSWTWTVRDLSGKVLREFTSLESGPNLAMTNRQWVKDYVWRDGLLLATITASGTLHYHLDHLGTPRLVTDANGVKVAEHAYYPFGAEINLTPHETPEEAMKFTGHERDIVAGDGHTLDYMHARYENASFGRFLSVDPAQRSMRPGIPQSWNRYSYAINNPIRYTDPYGLDWFKLDDQWRYLKDVHVMQYDVYNKDGKLVSSQTLNGVKFGLVFNGTGLTQLRADGTMRTIPAVSGRVDGWGEVHPAMQADRGRGPIPAGQYSFNPHDIQSITPRDRTLGIVGRGGWPGGTYAWGTQRVFLSPEAETNTYGRSGFSIHGGASPGSAGCIDLCDMAKTFFSEIPRNVDRIPVDVDYNNPLKP